MSQGPINYQTPPPRPTGDGSDTELETIDWVLVVICSGIGCILGIVYAVQGKPKGTKMIIYSIIASIIWGALRFAIASALHR